MKSLAIKCFCFLVIIFLFGFLFSYEKDFNYVFIVDVSTSMIGIPPSETSTNIFPKLKEEVCKFIDKIEFPANIFIYTFDAGLSSGKEYVMDSPKTKESIKKYITNLEADGTSTWIYRSLSAVLDSIRNFRVNSEEENVTVYYLFTDGKDNDSQGNWNMYEILKEYSLKRGEFDWLFYSTLGIELGSYEKEQLEKASNVKLVENERGVVHPIIIIENIIPIINLGNVWDKDSISWTNLFGMNDESIENYNIKLNLDYRQISSKGMGLKIDPLEITLDKSKEIKFIMKLINFSKNVSNCYGDHNCVIKLIPDDEFVDIIPNQIDVHFSFNPPKIVEVFTDGKDGKSLNLGTIKNLKEPLRKKIYFKYNFQKEKSKGIINIKNANYKLQKGINVLIEGANEFNAKNHDSVEIVFNFQENIKKGKYSGTLRILSDSFDLTGGKQDSYGTNKNAVEIPWSLTIPAKPIPLWVWLCIILLIAIGSYFIIKHLNKPAVMKDIKIEIIEPEKAEINLEGLREAAFGRGNAFLNEIDTSFIIYAKKENGFVKAVLELTDGDLLMKKYGNMEFENVINSENLYDGDMLKFNNYILRVSSFTLNRD